MARRNWYNDDTITTQGVVWVPFSFNTNNTSDPTTSTFRGCGGLTGTDAAANGTVSNSGPSAVATITRAGVGSFTVTFADGYRYALATVAQISGTDGFTAQCSTVSNEGSGHTTACTMTVTVLNAAGTATETTSRRVSVLVAFKNSGNGT
jgi:hypothetical protein